MPQRHGKLYNVDGELIAEGTCELKASEAGVVEVTMWPSAERALFDRQRGLLTLCLDDGAALSISDRRLRLNISPPGGERTSMYRMRVLAQPQREEEAAHTVLN